MIGKFFKSEAIILYHSSIEDEEVIENIFQHPGVSDLKVRPSAKVKCPSVTIPLNNSDSHVPCSVPSFYPDADSRWIRTGF
jgi:hypothetical protein